MPKRVHSASDRDDDAESTSNQSTAKRTRKAAEEREINDLCQELYDALRAYKSEDARVVCESFIRLPSKRAHSDYYTIVKQPIDLLRIQQKIRTDEYRTLAQFTDDIQLLLANAKIFYKKNSNEWRDATELSKYFYSKKQELTMARTDSPTADLDFTINNNTNNNTNNINNTISDSNVARRRPLRRQQLDSTDADVSLAQDASETTGKKRRSNRQLPTEVLVNGTSIKVEHDESTTDPSPVPSIDPYYFEEFFTAIYNAHIDNRAMSDIFLFLPSQKLYPDYYLIVANPIDLKMIAKKIHQHEYFTLDNMEDDLLLMIANARKYNDPKSQIYKDACSLRKMITTVRNELETAIKTSKTSNDRLRPRKRDVLLSSEIATMDYPEEPDDEEVVLLQQQKQTDDADSETSSLGDEDDSFRVLYNAVKSYKLGAQSLIDPFMKLPNKRIHQSYYEEIKRPIAMSLIKNHIKKGHYIQLADLVDDLQLMFNNAMQYNQEGSLIYNSAKKLLDVAQLKAHELGYDEHKPRIKEARVNVTMVNIKDEYLDSSSVHPYPAQQRSSPTDSSSPRTPYIAGQRGRPPKKLAKYTEQNVQALYTYIREYRENDIGLIAPFLQLPSAEEYPDYYETIQDPLDMAMVKDKLDKGMYKREQDIVDDFNRMFNNAKLYNVDGSYIFKYASKLERALTDQYKFLMTKKEKAIQNAISHRSVAGTPKKCLSFSSFKNLHEKLSHLFHSIKSYTNRHGRTLSTAFLTLPSKIDYPDYYEFIQRPIDLKRIELRHLNSQYPSVNDMCVDLQQMFDNACLYNEPGSTIYRDALSLQRVMIDKRRELTNDEQGIPNVPNLVHELMLSLFISTFNHEDEEGRFFSDSFTDLPEQAENEPFDIVYTFDLVKRNLDQRRYRRLDVFQEDLFKIFERARKLSRTDSQLYEDSTELQIYFIRLREEMCCHGSVLKSPALFFNEARLTEELARERAEKDVQTNLTNQNSTTTNSSTQIDDKSPATSKPVVSTERSSLAKGQTFYLGDFVYIEPKEEGYEPGIVCIESFTRENDEDFMTGLQFYRPDETYHLPTKKFLRQEVFLTNSIERIPMSKVQRLCHILHVKDYFKYQPIIIDQTISLKFDDNDKDIYVCESRYNPKTKVFKKIKWWNVPENNRIRLVQRPEPLDANRVPSTLVANNLTHRSSTTDSESNVVTTEIIEKNKETVPHDSVINQKLNENLTLPLPRQFYEQIVLGSNVYYKNGDYVYVTNVTNNDKNNNNELDKRLILRIDKIWMENDSFALSGPLFIRPGDIANRDQLIVTTKCSYDREVIKRDGSSTQISTENITGKCSVLSLKHYCAYRLTEIAEIDVYLCESKYVSDDHSLRRLSKSLKRPSLSSRVCADEIWTFRKELLFQRDSPTGPFKLIDDGSCMDVDDQTNSNHAIALDGDELHPNHLNFDAANNSNQLISSSITNRSNNTSRRSSRRGTGGSSARAPCGYLIFASESRKRLIRDNPGIPFGEMSRMIGDQWRRLNANERDKYEEKARERAREQESGYVPSTPMTNNNSYDTHVINPQRMVNGGVTMNGHYSANPNMTGAHQMNGGMAPVVKPPAAAIVTCPPRTQRLVHSEAYLRYIENLKPDNPFISDWPKQLKASISNHNGSSTTGNGNYTNGSITSRTLPSHWFPNASPGLYNNVHEALWAMRDHMWSDVVRIRNVLSDEW